MMTKKESLMIKKQIAKLEKNLSGIKTLEKKPDALFVIDTRYEKIAIQEANKLNIPVIAVVDSNNSFDGVDYMIPGNDDSRRSIDLYCSLIKETINASPKEIDFEINSENNEEDIIKSEVKDDGNNSNNKDISITEVPKNDS